MLDNDKDIEIVWSTIDSDMFLCICHHTKSTSHNYWFIISV